MNEPALRLSQIPGYDPDEEIREYRDALKYSHPEFMLVLGTTKDRSGYVPSSVSLAAVQIPEEPKTRYVEDICTADCEPIAYTDIRKGDLIITEVPAVHGLESFLTLRLMHNDVAGQVKENFIFRDGEMRLCQSIGSPNWNYLKVPREIAGQYVMKQFFRT